MKYVGKIRANELERWLDDTIVPLSDDEIKAMSTYFQSESFQYEDYLKDN